LKVAVQYGARARGVPTPAQLRRWARAALERNVRVKEGDAQVTLRIVSGSEGRALNRNFRGRDYATNVLSFRMRDRPDLEGDLALCAPVIAREARAQGKTLAAHYAHLVVHGILHLQGLDHGTRSEALRMERRESRIVTALGFPDPYENQG
jgi:probable rRNA maturation factor